MRTLVLRLHLAHVLDACAELGLRLAKLRVRVREVRELLRVCISDCAGGGLRGRGLAHFLELFPDISELGNVEVGDVDLLGLGGRVGCH